MLRINKTKIHKTIGIILFIPFLLWTITGIIFFIKPGYSSAYEQLKVKTYPFPDSVQIPLIKDALEQKVIKSKLGYHLLVKKDSGPLHLQLPSLRIFKKPDSNKLKLLINDAISNNHERYGRIIKVDGNKFITSKNVSINLDWNSLSLYQEGDDSRLINSLYKIHYLQWTGIKAIDDFLGIVGLLLVSCLAIIGILLVRRK